METIQKKTKESTKHYLVREMNVFEWVVEHEERLNNNKTLLTFKRDNEVSYYSELVKLEKEYFKTSFIPNWVLIILVAIVFSLFTLLLVFAFIAKGIIPFNQCLLYFLLPACLFALTLGILCVYNTRKVLNYMNNSQNKYKMYLDKVQELKNGK